MSENISINQVEKMTGVSKRNIRFYKKDGLRLESVILLLSGLAMIGIMIYRDIVLHFNDKTKM